MHLTTFCARAHELIHSLKGEARLNAFFKHRYHLLGDYYPHEPFGVDQADLNFFQTTYELLMGQRDFREVETSDYKGNYVRWIKKYQGVKH